METFKPIVVEEIIASKSSKLASRIPKFVYNWLSKILHVKDLNKIMQDYGHLKDVEFISAALKYFNITYNIHGAENIPDNERIMFTSNHPLGGLDGIILLKVLNDKSGNTKCLVNDFLMNVTPLKHLFIPINKMGGQARDSISKIEELYQSDDNILIFPAGLCSRKNKGKIQDLKWNKHFIQKAIKHKLNITPIYFGGKNSNFFYNLANIRKLLGIKFNIEMMFLSDEMFKHRNKSFDIYFGKQISFTNFDKSKNHNEWAINVKQTTYNIPNSLEVNFENNNL